MKSYFFIGLLICSFLISEAQTVDFHKDAKMEKMLNLAQDENKLVFVDAYTTWCGPCKLLDKNVFTNEDVANYFNENFISVKLDMEKKGPGLDFAKQHSVRQFPSLFFLNSQGEIVLKQVGYYEPDAFLDIAKTVIAGGEELQNLKDENAISEIFMSALMSEEGITEEDKEKAKSINEEIYNKVLPDFLRYQIMQKFSKEQSLENWNAFKGLIEEELAKESPDLNLLNSMAWTIYENHESIEDKTALKTALKASEKTIENIGEASHYELDTYAHIHYALGDILMAKRYEIIAYERALEEGNEKESKYYKEELDKFDAELKTLQ